MKNLVTLQSIYEQALELLIKYNPNALEELDGKLYELSVSFDMKYKPINVKETQIVIWYYETIFSSNRISMMARGYMANRCLEEFEELLKKQYGHGDPLLGMYEEQSSQGTEDDLPY